jgi:WS/DGAT/MGAT family acyltransferase
VDEPRAPERLSASDSLLWRIESDPVLRTPVVVVGLLDRSPTVAGVEATVERAAALVPRLRQRLDPPVLGAGRPRWRWADEPSLAYHVRRVRAPGGDLDAVLALTEPDVVAAFDPARPPWTITVVDGLDGGRAAVVLRFHHAITDGVGGIEIADLLFDRERRPRRGPAPAETPDTAAPGPAVPGAAVPEPPPDPLRWLAAGAAGARAAAGAALRPLRTAGAVARLARSTARTLAPSPGTGSPELTGRSLDRHLAVLERPLAGMRAAAAATGGTVNDVFVAAVAGALDAYHRAQGRPVPAVRVTMPISVRRPGDPLAGNRFVPARFTLPVDDPDPRARARIAGAIVRSWRHEPALASTGLLSAGLDLLPRGVATRLFAGMLRAVDVGIVDVPGLDRPAYLGGARLERLWAFAPSAGAALTVTLVSHRRKACVGLACDRLAVTDPQLLEACLSDALDEVIALGAEPATGHAPAGRRTA